MKKKLLLLNLVLLAVVLVIGERVRQRWLEARKREAAVLGQPLKQLPPPPYSALAPVPPVTAAEYNEVAQKMLFSADRNPTVTVEVVPPPPMPKLPAYFGMVDLGEPLAIMSAEPGAEHKQVRFGEKIGEFTLVSVEDEQIVLEWRGEKVVRKTTELVERKEQASAQPRPPAAKPKPKPEPVTKLVELEKKGSAPGIDVGASYRACQPGDTRPAGTIVEGYRKVERASPFGGTCLWEPVK